jgi:hypothetical protein
MLANMVYAAESKNEHKYQDGKLYRETVKKTYALLDRVGFWARAHENSFREPKKITGYVGTVYFRIDEMWRGDIWRSNAWPTPAEVLDEFLDRKQDVLEALETCAPQYSGYSPGAGKKKNARHVKRYEAMITELRAGLKPDGIEDFFDDIEIFIGPIEVHLPT